MGDVDWSDWTAHDGMGCPVALGMLVQIKAERITGEKVQLECYASDVPGWHWDKFGQEYTDPDGTKWIAGRILSYRYRRYASVKLIEDTLRTVTSGGLIT